MDNLRVAGWGEEAGNHYVDFWRCAEASIESRGL